MSRHGCGLFFYALTLLLATLSSSAHAAEQAGPAAETPVIAEASDEAERAMAGFSLPQGWASSVFAAEPMMANPVAFHITDQGDVYVAESYRQSAGVEDNRSHMYWVLDDIAAMTVEDRRAFTLKHRAKDIRHFTRRGEQLRMLRDENQDGVADRSTIFAAGFNDIVSGSAAGVIERDGDVYFACIPDLWLLRDKDNDGLADEQRSLLHGFGVRVAFKGHDLHGLTVGPDGKLYFTIGDRGYHVETPEGLVANPESGAVFRCNWDGTGLEVIHSGLRNPQELAFDDYGNLFVADNDSDSYDESRWLPIIDGGDSGWRMAFQYFIDRGPFFREKLWYVYHKEQAAYIAPIIAHVGSGPSGMAVYPGTGLSSYFDGRIFLSDFRGGAVNSGVDTFRVKSKGAFFELVDFERTIRGVLATDVAFGPDGAFYISDWVHGWNGEGKGRIYRFTDSRQGIKELVEQVQRLLREGLKSHTTAKLVELLAHADRRIRQRAQFELVRRSDFDSLLQVARSSSSNKSQLARIHALWGLGQLLDAEHRAGESKNRESIETPLASLLEDDDDEIRAQAAKLIGGAKLTALRDGLQARLADASLRVRYMAMMSLSQLGPGDRRQTAEVLTSVVNILTANDDADPMIRHAGIMCLTRIGDEESLAILLEHPSVAVRRALAVALRRRGDPLVAKLLSDESPLVVDEAARAIHDVPIAAAMPQLAAMIDSKYLLIKTVGYSDAVLRRALNANFRLAGEKAAPRLAAVAASEEMAEHLRVEALKMLSTWAEPSGRDRVLGMWRPIDPRDKSPAVDALTPVLPEVLSAVGAVRSEAARTAAALDIQEVVPVLVRIVHDRNQEARVRADSLATLSLYEKADLRKLLAAMVNDTQSLVRIEARRVQAVRHPEAAIMSLVLGIRAEELRERQAAWRDVASLELAQADNLVSVGLSRMIKNRMPADTRLDVLMAAKGRTAPRVVKALQIYRDRLPKDDPTARFRETLVGGRAERGRDIFFNRQDVSCKRCHKIAGRGGSIGPDLSKVAIDKKRQYLMESIVVPNRAIAKGFEPVQIVTDEGLVHSGIVESEDEQLVRLITPQGNRVEVQKSAIEERGVGLSAMPADIADKLSPEDVRDLVEFLANLKGEK